MASSWLQSFKSFYADMGDKPSAKHSLDRLDVNGPYSKENCRWATSSEQARNRQKNRLLTYGGQTKTIAEWAEITQIKFTTLYARLFDMGWSPDQALTTPVRAIDTSYKSRLGKHSKACN